VDGVRVLVVEDERKMGGLLRRGLQEEGYAVDLVQTGAEAVWAGTENPYDAIVLDVMLPDLDGFEVLRRLRTREVWTPVLMLTARDAVADRVSGLDAGADDYLTKPFDPDELRARINVGVRVLTLQDRLTERVNELQDALANVKQLHGLLPICSYCKRIRGDDQYWTAVESYIAERSDAQFSHGICPPCASELEREIERHRSSRPR
jgi:phosphoserine phosphatase RsbU/P